VRLGLVLGAGGTPGYGWHTGVLRALEEVAGLDPRLIDAMVGTSAGAYAAAYLRGGFSGASLFDAAVGVEHTGHAAGLAARVGAIGQLAAARRPLLRPIAPSVAAPGTLAAAFRAGRPPRVGPLLAGLLPAGTVSGEPFLGPLRKLWHGRDWPEGMRIPAVRVRDGAQVVFDGSQGPFVADAVAASSAVPAYMEPIVIDGETYVDGSAYAPTSADLLAGEPLDLVLVSAPMAAAPDAEARWGRDVGVRLWAGHHLRRETEVLVRAGMRVLTLSPTAASRAVLKARGRSNDERRAAAAKAAYSQVIGARADLLAALSG
jgi:NTE family protein